MRHINQKGLGLVQVLLLLVIVGLIGGTGFYVYKSQKETNKSLDSAKSTIDDLSQQDQQGDTEQAATEEETWLLFEPDDKAYSVRIPDGWQTISLNNNLYILNADKMVYTKDTKATVEKLTDGGWDGPSRLAIYNPGSYYDQIVREGTRVGTITTNHGLVAHKYVYKQEAEPEGIGYQKGDTGYNYYFEADGRYIQIAHTVSIGQTDQHELIERMIKTLQVN